MHKVYHAIQQLSLFPTKFCPRCKAEKSTDDFYRNPGMKDGYQRSCKECAEKRTRELACRVEPSPIRVCSKCGNEKSLDQFHRTRRSKDGYHRACKICRSEEGKVQYAANIEKEHARSRRYYEAHKEQTAVRTRRRYSTKRDKVREEHRKWRKANPERQRAYQKKFRNKPERKAYAIAWRNANPTRQRKYLQHYRSKPEAQETRKRYVHSHRLQIAELRRRRVARLWGTHTERISYQRILQVHGHICHICQKEIEKGITEWAKRLTFDHVVPLMPRLGEAQGTHTEDNIRPAHMVCNVRKGNKPLESLTPFDRRGPDIQL